MVRLRDVSIRHKLTGMILLVSTVTLVAAAAVIVSYEVATSRELLADDMRGLADVVGLNSRAALEFDDPDAAAENLRALAAHDLVVSAAIYTLDGSLFAAYRRDEGRNLPAVTDDAGMRFGVEYFDLARPIGHADAPVGVVHLRADLAPFQARLVRYAAIVAGMFGALLLMTLGLAIAVQRIVSTPLLELASVARGITERGDFGLRAQGRSSDEVGLLTDALNSMLDRIQVQTADLREAYRELEQRHGELEREIADRHRAEAAVRALNAELEERVSARTAELQTANQELEGFSYSVSHDLRAPLRGIDGFVRILEQEYRDSLDGEARRLIGMVRSNCNAMRQLIDDLLAFSRLGRQALTLVPTDMTEMVAETVAELHAIPGDTVPDIAIDPLPDINGDRALLRQVWFNLIANAIKFSSKRANPQVRVWSESSDDEMVYAVTDNGVGFDMRYYDKLFGVFQRLHRSEEFPGTGVGLATVKRIIVRHGGRVWAEGRVDEGSTFYFSLPRRSAA
jgi:signal transduction histidine kinase